MMTEPDVVAAITGWAERDGALYERLAGALRDAISRRDLAPGARLQADCKRTSPADGVPVSRPDV